MKSNMNNTSAFQVIIDQLESTCMELQRLAAWGLAGSKLRIRSNDFRNQARAYCDEWNLSEDKVDHSEQYLNGATTAWISARAFLSGVDAAHQGRN